MAPIVLVTATTAASHVRLDATYTDALVESGLVPMILPPVCPDVALGGTLIQDITSPHPRGLARVHDVRLDADSRLSTV